MTTRAWLPRVALGAALLLVGLAQAGPAASMTTAATALQARKGPDGRPRGAGQAAGADGSPARAASQRAQPIDGQEWARRLAALSEADWRGAVEVGEELAALPADEGFGILQTNWKHVGKVDSRQQLLKAWWTANHPRLVDGLDLGMRDPSRDVQSFVEELRRPASS